jgi:hypothetical protein
MRYSAWLAFVGGKENFLEQCTLRKGVECLLIWSLTGRENEGPEENLAPHLQLKRGIEPNNSEDVLGTSGFNRFLCYDGTMLLLPLSPKFTMDKIHISCLPTAPLTPAIPFPSDPSLDCHRQCLVAISASLVGFCTFRRGKSPIPRKYGICPSDSILALSRSSTS